MNGEFPEVRERARLRAEALRRARATLASVRGARPGASMHRAIHNTPLRAGAMLQACAIAGLFGGLLLVGQRALMGWWQEVILFWAAQLGLPLADGGPGALRWTSPEGAGPFPSLLGEAATGAAVIALWAATYWMSDPLTPLKYLVRILCAVQATALAVFVIVPDSFSHTVPDHLQTILQVGYGLMLAVAALLALSYCVLRIPLVHKLLHPALVLGYFALMLPHQAVLHALVLQHLSILFMPLLYLCFGVVFDVMVFVALYSWLVSGVPADALS